MDVCVPLIVSMLSCLDWPDLALSAATNVELSDGEAEDLKGVNLLKKRKGALKNDAAMVQATKNAQNCV